MTKLPEAPSVEPAPKPEKPKKPRRRYTKADKAKKAAVENPWPDDTQKTRDEPGADPLHNPKHERFAQNIASGMPLQEAYRDAGYAGDPGNGRRLRGDDAVWLRIEWLKREIGKRVIEATVAVQVEKIKTSTYTKDDALREADEVLRMAMSLGQGGPAVNAVRLKAMIAGVPLEQQPTQAPTDDVQAAREKEDPAMLEAFNRLKRAQTLMLTGPNAQKTEVKN